MSRRICQHAAMAGTGSESWLGGCSQCSALGAGLCGEMRPWVGTATLYKAGLGLGTSKVLVYSFGSPAAIGLVHILTSIM